MSNDMKIRTFKIQFSYGLIEEVNDLMRQLDLFQGLHTGISLFGTFTTTNTLPFKEYKELIAKAFENNGGYLYDIKEIIGE